MGAHLSIPLSKLSDALSLNEHLAQSELASLRLTSKDLKQFIDERDTLKAFVCGLSLSDDDRAKALKSAAPAIAAFPNVRSLQLTGGDDVPEDIAASLLPPNAHTKLQHVTLRWSGSVPKKLLLALQPCTVLTSLTVEVYTPPANDIFKLRDIMLVWDQEASDALASLTQLRSVAIEHRAGYRDTACPVSTGIVVANTTPAADVLHFVLALCYREVIRTQQELVETLFLALLR
jgi:hypothetical protein